MSNRYCRIFRLPENLYAEGSPVLIPAGVLTWDAEEELLYAQLKFRNLTESAIARISVSILPTNAQGEPIGEPIAYVYEDVGGAAKTVFGGETAVPMPEEACGFSVSVTEIGFESGETFSPSAEWRPLPSQKPVAAELWNAAQRERYRELFGRTAKYLPYRGKSVWLCACGAANPIAEENCSACGASLEKLEKADGDFLRRRTALSPDRPARENLGPARPGKRHAVNPPPSGITRFLVLLLAILSLLMFSGVMYANTVVLYQLVGDSLPEFSGFAYQQAVSQMENGKYEQALRLLRNTADDPDNLGLICECMLDGEYAQAVKLGWKNMVLPEGTASIPKSAFAGTALESVTIPDSVTSIGASAFLNCTSLKEIHYQGTKLQWERVTKGTDWDKNAGDYVFYYYSAN